MCACVWGGVGWGVCVCVSVSACVPRQPQRLSELSANSSPVLEFGLFQYGY